MKTYIFNVDEPKDRTVNACNPFTKRVKRIAKFTGGEFRTQNPDLFLKMRKKFPNYKIEYDKPKDNYNLLHKNRLVSMAAKRGIAGAITKKKDELVRILERDDARKNNEVKK